LDEGLIAEAVGAAATPIWIFDLDRIRENARELERIAGPGSIAYAIKANDHPAVLRAARQAGVNAEAASGREYRLAREAGFAGPSIIFNGPLKSDDDLGLAFTEGALVNADSLEELKRMLNLAADNKHIGIRVQANLIEGAVGDRFGLSAEEANEAAGLISAAGLALEQLHTHLGSYAVRDVEGPTAKKVDLIWPRDPQLTAALTSRLIEAALRLAAAGLEPKTISLGGGLPSLPAAADHVRAAASRLTESGLASRLTFEPGRAIVSDAAVLVCRVVQVRSPDRNGRQQVVVDAGVNLLPSVEWRDVELTAIGPTSEARPTVVFGPLCLQSDVLAWASPLPELRIGDILVAGRVGAYNWVRSTPFIFPTAPVVLVEEGKMRVDAGERTSR
jgi:diaminopimelate decarboxylase